MLVQILGTAAGGGGPQWNCACHGGAAARADPARRRRHASIAVRTGAGEWFVVNATPDIADQIETSDALRPAPGTRRSPVAGVILTDAELDHTLGLPRLREAPSLRVLATGTVRAALSTGLRLDAVLTPYTDLTWTDLGDAPTRLDGLEVQPIRVSGKRPRYAVDLDPPGDSWVVALRVTEDGRTLVYAPCLAEWPAELDKAVRDADCVILDGTFWDDDEPRRAGFTRRTATEMGHLPITGPNGTAARLTATRALYTHLNNTNPLVDPDAAEHRALAGMGLEVASERPERAVIDL